MIELAKVMECIRGMFAAGADESASMTKFEVNRPAEQWRQVLAPEQYRVLREHGTEPPWSSSLLKEEAAGTFRCAGCGQTLYASDAKFDSGTGWPSFTVSIDDAVETSTDRSMIMARTEVHCRKCGGHLGHRFADGPAPSGMRHCINGAALNFDAV